MWDERVVFPPFEGEQTWHSLGGVIVVVCEPSTVVLLNEDIMLVIHDTNVWVHFHRFLHR